MAAVVGWFDDPDLDWDLGWKARWRAWIGRDTDSATEDGSDLSDVDDTFGFD